MFSRLSALLLILSLGGCGIIPDSWIAFFTPAEEHSGENAEDFRFDGLSPVQAAGEGAGSAFAPVQVRMETPFAVAVMKTAEGEVGRSGADVFEVLTVFNSASGRLCKVAAVTADETSAARKSLVCNHNGKSYVAREIF